MNACVKLGGDPTLGAQISIHNFSVTQKIVDRLKEYFPKLHPLDVRLQIKTLDLNPDLLPDIKCCACNHYVISSACTPERALTKTHIHSSLEVDGGGIFLLCRDCAQRIKWFFENWSVIKNLVQSKASAAI